MKTGLSKKVILLICAFAVLSPMLLAPSAEALTLNFSYSDNFLSGLTVTSNADVVKPGNTLTVSVTGQLKATGQSVTFQVIFSVDTSTQNGRMFDSRYIPLSGTSNTIVASLIIPQDAKSNSYVYAKISNGTITFSQIPIALVQTPLYSELQTQLATALANSTNLQGNLTNLQKEKAALQDQVKNLQDTNTGLQQQINSLRTNNTNLQNQLSTLQTSYNKLLSLSQTDKTSLLNQINNLTGNNTQLQNQISTLNSNNSILQTQINSIVTDNSNLQSQLALSQANVTSLESQLANVKSNNNALQTQINNLQADKNSLLNQTASLQSQISSLEVNSTNLESMVDTLINQSSNLQSQLSRLQTDYKALQSKENNTSVLMYLSLFIAAIFIIATISIIVIVTRSKVRKKPDEDFGFGRTKSSFED